MDYSRVTTESIRRARMTMLRERVAAGLDPLTGQPPMTEVTRRLFEREAGVRETRKRERTRSCSAD
jgi:hypothetical protein